MAYYNISVYLWRTTHCNTLQHTATHCNTLQHTAYLWRTREYAHIQSTHIQSTHIQSTHIQSTHILSTHIRVTWLYTYMWHDSIYTHVMWLAHPRDMTHTPMWHDSYTYVQHDSIYSLMCHNSNVTWLIRMPIAKRALNTHTHTHTRSIARCDMTQTHMWHDSNTHVTWLTHTCDMTHTHMWHDSHTHVAWLTHPCGMTHSHTSRQKSPKHLNCETGLIRMRDMTHTHACNMTLYTLMRHDSHIYESWHSQHQRCWCYIKVMYIGV